MCGWIELRGSPTDIPFGQHSREAPGRVRKRVETFHGSASVHEPTGELSPNEG